MSFFATNPQGASLMTRIVTNFPLVFVLIRAIRGRFLMPPKFCMRPVHPNPASAWKRTLLEKGPEIFAQDSTVAEYERRIAKLERLLGQKEVEIALLKNFLGQTA